jgi:hypothetical protein
MVFLLFIISAQSVYSSNYYPTDFKESVKNGFSKSVDMKEKLFLLMSKKHIRVKNGDDILADHCGQAGTCYGQKSLGYKTARRILFGKLHLKQNENGYFVKDVYCGKIITKKISNVGPNIIPKNSIMNCEHTWPQSRFNTSFPKGTQKSDLHHLFPTDSNANGVRGNNEFAEVNGFPVRNCKGSFEGAERGLSGRYFEPPVDQRGNTARALFYFSVRYKLKIRSVEESYLRKWHEDDPADQDEIDRNDMIHKVQGNRNPFIDYPNLVNEVSNF